MSLVSVKAEVLQPKMISNNPIEHKTSQYLWESFILSREIHRQVNPPITHRVDIFISVVYLLPTPHILLKISQYIYIAPWEDTDKAIFSSVVLYHIFEGKTFQRNDSLTTKLFSTRTSSLI